MKTVATGCTYDAAFGQVEAARMSEDNEAMRVALSNVNSMTVAGPIGDSNGLGEGLTMRAHPLPRELDHE